MDFQYRDCVLPFTKIYKIEPVANHVFHHSATLKVFLRKLWHSLDRKKCGGTVGAQFLACATADTNTVGWQADRTQAAGRKTLRSPLLQPRASVDGTETPGLLCQHAPAVRRVATASQQHYWEPALLAPLGTLSNHSDVVKWRLRFFFVKREK